MNYQKRLETAAYLKMAVIMAVSGLAFITAPNPTAFRLLAENGLTLVPALLGLFCFVGMAGYLLLLAGIPHKHRSVRTLRTLFLVCSFPLALYMTTLGAIQVARGASTAGFGAFGYLLIYGIIFLVAFAVFHGYSRALELISIGTLVIFMWLAAYSFILSPPSFLRVFNLSPVGFTILCLLGSLGYSLLLHPTVAALSVERKHLWFSVSALVIPLYALFLGVNTLRINGNYAVTFILIFLYLLIALLGHALYRPDNRLKLGRL